MQSADSLTIFRHLNADIGHRSSANSDSRDATNIDVVRVEARHSELCVGSCGGQDDGVCCKLINSHNVVLYDAVDRQDAGWSPLQLQCSRRRSCTIKLFRGAGWSCVKEINMTNCLNGLTPTQNKYN